MAVHAAALLAVMSVGNVLHRTHAAPEDHPVIERTKMTLVTWVPAAAPEPVEPVKPARPARPARAAVPERVVKIRARKVVPVVASVSTAPAVITVPKAEQQPVSFEELALFRPPSQLQAPSDDNVSVLFVGVENGEWLRWLTARHGSIGFTTHRDDVIERVYSVSGDLLSTSSVMLADVWALELNQPDRVAAIADMLARERKRAEDPSRRIRIFALFPASFRDEVASAIRRTGGTAGVFLVSFSGDELRVAAAAR